VEGKYEDGGKMETLRVKVKEHKWDWERKAQRRSELVVRW
jgi:hypothetical protein